MSESEHPSCSATLTLLTEWPGYERTPASHPSHFSTAYDAHHQNLLKTLTASRVKSSFPESDLKLLLSAVKETRVSAASVPYTLRCSYFLQKAANDPAKLADAFYDSLEGLLYDLRMVTMVTSTSATHRVLT